MNSPRCSPSLFVVVVFIPVISLLSASCIHAIEQPTRSEGFGRRVLLSFKETPGGRNVTFDCSPSGPCVPCLYSEKGDAKYRCSETGYRIPFKCIEIEDGSKDANGKKSRNGRSTLETSDSNFERHRSLVDDSPTIEGKSQAYITYRSCIPAVNEEKLSVLGFEGIIFCLLLISGSVVYIRRKRTVNTMAGVGAGRIQTNSRF
ncbi:uncharacterized protein LOC120007537 [Tripterygium wilfordii]|uniref:uncharacterized protein LOC120007537 n=1 Tax=Tripterygium wilfordii TaxID=458696 RepID=UPI0018F83B77|nr:uncharacterized protein LOC120007537 [Tripterygium wilfordii]